MICDFIYYNEKCTLLIFFFNVNSRQEIQTRPYSVQKICD